MCFYNSVITQILNYNIIYNIFKKTSKIFILISIGQNIEIFQVLYTLYYTSNLLLLLQFNKTKISYYDGDNYIILNRDDKKVAYTKQNWYLFILKSIIRLNLAILVSIHIRSTYF